MNEESNVPAIRFKGFTDPWEQRQLGEVARHVTERNLDQRLKETFTNSAEYGIISQRDYFDHSISNAGNTHNYVIVAPGDFVYNPRISGLAPVGPIRRNRLGRAGIVSPLYQVFRCEHMSGRFLEHYFFTDKWHNYMVIEGNTGARSDRLAITAISFFTLPIPRPTNEEQHRIGSFLDRLDSLITLHQRQQRRRH